MEDLLQVCHHQSVNSATGKKEPGSALSLTKNNSFASSSSRHLQEGVKSHQLVCAARNLHQSLMRCQWMVEVQRLLGLGRFGANAHDDRRRQEYQESDGQIPPASQQQMSKDVIKVCELADAITDLDLQNIVDNYQEQDGEYVEVLKQMKELQIFTVDFKLLFMPLPKNAATSVRHLTISIGP